MNLGVLEWSIIIGAMVFLTYAALTTRKYTKSVADFLSANRCADRYLLGIACGEAAFGAITVIAWGELFYEAGWTYTFFTFAGLPIGLLFVLTGFFYYRFRATRALTMGQFFEMRYSRKFRVFSGILCFFSGVINFGIFPQVGARFFVNFLTLPPELPIFGVLVPTFEFVMFILVALALFYTFIGGQIAVLVTDFWQGLFATIIFAAIIAFLWYTFSWDQMKEALLIVSEPGLSRINPFDIKEQPDFNIWYFVILLFLGVYGRGAWQVYQGYNSCPTTAHEAKMIPVAGHLRGQMIILGMMIIPLAAITVMNHPDYAAKAAEITSELQTNYPNDEFLQRQMRVVTVLRHVVPTFLTGCFTLAMLGFFISTNNTCMHSWGTIFIQDVMCPFLKTPLTNKQHLRVLRLSIIGVAVFAYIWSMLFPIKDYIMMYMRITAAIYLGGAGSAILGGLYWKRGTTLAAWVAMISGSFFACSSLVLQAFWDKIPFLVAMHPKFPMNGQVAAFWSAAIAVIAYISISLLGKKHVANMDRILHRGKYAIKDEEDALKERGAGSDKPISRFWRMIGVNSHEFNKVDKFLFLFYTVCYAGWPTGSFFVLSALSAMGLMNDSRWLTYWRITIFITLSVACFGVIWVNIGGLFDLRRMYRRLSERERNRLDDGRVSGDHLLADEKFEAVSDTE